MQIDEQFLSEIAQDMRDNGGDDEVFISETINAIRKDSRKNVTMKAIIGGKGNAEGRK